MQDIIIAVASSTVITAVVTTFLAPRVNWGFEKKRTLQQNRKNLISEIRQYIRGEDFSRVAFVRTEEYSRIRPHLSAELNKKIMNKALVAMISSPVLKLGADHYLRIDISKELHDLEVRWELI